VSFAAKAFDVTVDGLPFVWGIDKPNDALRKGSLANIWQCVFPALNDVTDGFERTARVHPDLQRRADELDAAILDEAEEATQL
jgi:hypothetical protein